MSWASELPDELLCHPTGLVALTGLDTTYNAVHRAIWDSFCNNRRTDRVPLNFKVFTLDYEYHKCKPKKSSYEYYIPKGILKTTWMKKQLEEVPSVVVLFFDLDWDNSIWKEKQMECSTKVEIVRNSLQGRGTRVCMVLIQKNAPLPPGEDLVAAERAASLCSACELSAKALFVLPLTDHILGYTIRLENQFFELSQNYYHTEARKVKAHKEFLNKTTHQLLYVRHQFKIAFFSELKQDTHTAIKHYKQAYGHIMETRMYDTNLLEVKTIAGFINYKICRLSFYHNAPLDAISQFRKHIDFFKSRVGISELAFEHEAWQSKQFQVFGDLFDDAIKSGLTAIQTQHPGLYYQSSAMCAVKRKQLCMGLCNPATLPKVNADTASLPPLDFFGQRYWRQGHQSIEPPDLFKEKDGIQMLQALEIQENHPMLIIPMFSSAVAQYKKYKSPRMKRHIMVQMGDEYYHAKDYNKALALLSRVTWDYRQERWWLLLTNILHTALRCAYLVANLQEYVSFALELVGKYTLCSVEEKTRIQMNLMKVMRCENPDPEPGCNTECVEKAKALWQSESAFLGEFTIEMQNIVPFVECKACFTQEYFNADHPVTIKVFIRVASPLPMTFSKLSVLLNSQAYSEKCVIVDDEDGELNVEPGVTLVKTFSFLPHKEDVGKPIEITSIVLEMGSSSSRCAILHWTGGGGDSLLPSVNQNKQLRPKKRQPVTDSTPWEMVEVHSMAKLHPRDSLLAIELSHAPPCLVNEYYHLHVKLINNEEVKITNVRFDVGLKEAQGIEVAQSTHISLDKPEYIDGSDKVPIRKNIEIEDMESKETCIKEAYLKAWQIGDRRIVIKVSYDVNVAVDGEFLMCHCVKEENVSLSTVDPFNIIFRLASLQLKAVETIHAEEPFLLISDIKCVSPWMLEIENSNIIMSPFVKFVDETVVSQLEGVVLKSSDCASECQCLMALPVIQSPIQLGHYEIKWRRKRSKENDVNETTTITEAGRNLPFVSTTTTLPSVGIEHIPLFVDLDIPAYGNVRTGMPVTYNIYNRTSFSQEIEVTMESSESFMFSGQKAFHVRILPTSKYQLKYNFVPLLPGNAPLPKLHINMVRYPGMMDDAVQLMLPSHMFVMPSGKQPHELNNMQPQLVEQ